MSVEYFITTEGEFIGAFLGGAKPASASAITVPLPPKDASQIWDFELGEWGDIPVPVPEFITMRQARLALLGAGLYESVETAINNLPSPQKEAARIEWDYSSVVYRNKPFVLSLGAALSLSAGDMDNLFITAQGIE